MALGSQGIISIVTNKTELNHLIFKMHNEPYTFFSIKTDQDIWYFFRNIFCYAGWKSLHTPIAIIKLSGLNVFIYSVEGVGHRNVRPIKMLIPSVLIDFPTCLSTCVFAYLCAPSSCRQDTSSTHSRTLCRQRKWQTNQQPDLPSWYCSTFTNCTIKFSLFSLQGGWDVRVQCYQAKVSIFQDLLLHL